MWWNAEERAHHLLSHLKEFQCGAGNNSALWPGRLFFPSGLSSLGRSPTARQNHSYNDINSKINQKIHYSNVNYTHTYIYTYVCEFIYFLAFVFSRFSACTLPIVFPYRSTVRFFVYWLSFFFSFMYRCSIFFDTNVQFISTIVVYICMFTQLWIL